jgi:PadR family transcriptional regulator AphA
MAATSARQAIFVAPMPRQTSAASDNVYVVLGTLRLGAKSGYEVRRWIERSANFFWTISPAHVYPALQWLEAEGYIKGRDSPSGGRARRTFKITAAGERALREWLRSPADLTFELRDRGLLKLFFADVLDPDEAIAHVRAMRLRATDGLAEFERDIEPASVAEERSGIRFPHITATFAIEFYRWVIDWCQRLEAQLEAESSAVTPARKAAR